jgi:proteasome lid subunit RPN8/RPN11
MVVEAAVLDAIVRHARDAAPNECCGLLLGKDGRIDEAVRTRNVKESPSAFQVDPADHFAAIRRARADGRQVLGAYHSHPRSPAEPSPRDIAEAHDDALVHVIVSLAEREPRIAAFRISKGAVDPVALGIRPSVDSCGRRL